MDPEELLPKKPKTHTLGDDLSRHSVGDLEVLRDALEAEQIRVRQALGSKLSSRAAADAAFKS